MSGLANLLRALVVDPRSRRALDETLLDATEEIAHTSGVGAQCWAAARAGVALGRVGLGSFGRELQHLHATSVVIVLLATFSVPVVVTATVWPAITPSSGSRATLFALLTIGPIAAFFPVSAFVVGIAAARLRASLLGLTVVLVVVEVALVGWLMPEANQQFKQRIYSVGRTATMPLEIRRGVNELPLQQLVRASRVPEASRARQQLYVRMTLCAATMWFVGLGYGAMRLSPRARILWASAAVLTIVAIGYFRLGGFTLLVAFGLALTLAIVRAHRDPVTA
ncbi:MAG TPA: hypothetical protein VFV98_10410 [Vicinamibacterales bacterium]|nr:hypothetical protein [Vicinamibacterales bacterium]